MDNVESALAEVVARTDFHGVVDVDTPGGRLVRAFGHSDRSGGSR